MKLFASIFAFLLLLNLQVATAQVVEIPPLTSDNVQQLTSVLQVDFADLPDNLGELIETGWFTISPDGQYIALVRQDGGLIILNMQGELVETYILTGENNQPGIVLDAMFGSDSQALTALHNDGESFFVSVHEIATDETHTIPFPEAGDMPVRVWLDADLTHVWLEVAPGDFQETYYVIRLPISGDEEPLILPSGPQNDLTSYVRIGRIPAPLAITSTLEGLVKLWNLETNEVTAQVQLEAVPAFGRVDETTGRYLAWRDTNSESLNLLDFETGENRFIAPLGGEYVQAILVNPAADLILGVAIGDDPIVVAWDVTTGERFDLGEYRECSRVPDMIALSRIGNALVVGCDTGLDIWRVDEG